MNKLLPIICLALLCSFSATAQYSSYSSPPSTAPPAKTHNQVLKVEEAGDQGLKLYSKTELQQRLAYFSTQSWEALKAQAKTQNKPFFVAFETPWCRVCKKMDHEVYARDRVANYARNHFLAYKLDGEQRPDVAQRYSISSYPTLLIFDQNGSEVKRIIGATTENQFIEVMKQFSAKVPHTKYSSFR